MDRDVAADRCLRSVPQPNRYRERCPASLSGVAKGGNIDLLFVGDSITDWWRQAQRGLPMWNEFFAPLKRPTSASPAIRLRESSGGCRTAKLDGFKAKLIVLMLGTNNINRNPNDDIAEGQSRDRQGVHETPAAGREGTTAWRVPARSRSRQSVTRVDQGNQREARHDRG